MNTRRWLITGTACLLLLVGLAGFKYMQIQAAIAYGASFPEPSETVRAITVEESPSQIFTSTIGEIMAPDAIMLRNELEGRIVEINMESGAEVKQGDLLLRLDTSEERARLKAAEANASLADLNLKRMEKLRGNKTVSQEQLDQSRAQYDVALANVAELKATIAKKTLTAPFDAVVGLHDLEVGEYLGANMELVQLVGLNDFLWVDFNLPMAQGMVAIGEEVKVALPKPATGDVVATVVAKNPSLTASSRNLRYRAKVLAQDGLPPHSIVKVLVPTAEKNQIHVPTPAVLRDEMGSYVFRLEPEAEGNGYRAQRQSVTLGREEAQTLAIASGLKSGALVATDGAFKLHHGMLAFVGERPDTDATAAPEAVQ